VLFRMNYVIDGILAMRIMVQFVGQAIGVTLLRRRNGVSKLPYKMPMYPLPVVLAIVMWLFVFYATGRTIILSFFLVAGSGIIMYLVMARMQRQWPFKTATNTLNNS
jgi:fructoselysine transporter